MKAVNTVVQRMQKPTPKFFRKLRNIGLVMLAVSGAILTAPIAMPAVLVTAAGYAAIAGTVMSGVSQSAVKYDK